MYARAPAYRVIMQRSNSLVHYISLGTTAILVKSQFLEPVCYRFIVIKISPISRTSVQIYKNLQKILSGIFSEMAPREHQIEN
jgi:hypothetical protein